MPMSLENRLNRKSSIWLLLQDQHDQTARGVVTHARLDAQDPGITTRALSIARREHLKELLVNDLVLDLTANHEMLALFRVGDELLGERPQLLRLRDRGLDALMLEQARR